MKFLKANSRIGCRVILNNPDNVEVNFAIVLLDGVWYLTSREVSLSLQLGEKGKLKYSTSNTADVHYPTTYMFEWVPSSAEFANLEMVLKSYFSQFALA